MKTRSLDLVTIFTTLALFLSLFAPAAQAQTTVYDSFLDDVFAGTVDKTLSFKCMLTNGYTPALGTHTKRSDVTNEASGTGYTAGGQSVTPTWVKNTGSHTFVITFPTLTWSTATITATRKVCYVSRGGAASADELVFTDAFGSTVSSTGGTFTANASTLTFTLP